MLSVRQPPTHDSRLTSRWTGNWDTTILKLDTGILKTTRSLFPFCHSYFCQFLIQETRLLGQEKKKKAQNSEYSVLCPSSSSFRLCGSFSMHNSHSKVYRAWDVLCATSRWNIRSTTTQYPVATRLQIKHKMQPGCDDGKSEVQSRYRLVALTTVVAPASQLVESTAITP